MALRRLLNVPRFLLLYMRYPILRAQCLILFFLLIFTFAVSPVWAISKNITSPLKKPPKGSSDQAPAAAEPVHLTADRLEFLKDENLYNAEGSVVVTQGPLRIESDFLSLDNESGRLLATGNVHLTDGGNKMDAEQMEVNVNTQLGILFEGKLFIKSDNYHLEGEEMERLSEDRYNLSGASFTACDCEDDPDWRIRARQMRVHMEHYLVVRDLVFYVDEVPVLYLPYFVYPVKTERQTGLLVPSFGYGSKYGLRYTQAFYWAISKNQDATFTLDDRGKMGTGGAVEYRYVLSRDSRGTLTTKYFYDNLTKGPRWEIQYNHQQRLTERVNLKLDVHYVNEPSNFLALSDQTAERAQQNIESNLFLTYRGDDAFAYLLARYTLDLTAPNNNTTLQRLPEIGYSLIERRLGASPLFFNFDSVAVNFWRPQGVKAERVDLYPKLSLPVPLGDAVTVTPWAGFREIWYSRGAAEDRSLGRNIFPAGVDLESRFYGSWGGMTHLIAPSLMYEYISSPDQTDIPQFDALDRLHDRNGFTASLAQRFLTADEKGNRIEWVYFLLTESYNIQEVRAQPENPGPYSDLRGEWTLRPLSLLSIQIDSFYNLYDHVLSSWNTDLNFDPAPFLTVSLGQRYTREGSVPQKGDLFNPLYLGDRETTPRIQFWTERAVIRTPWGISLASRSYFDVDQSKFVEIDYGLRYERQCWGVTLAYLDLRDRNELSFMVTLKGLGGAEEGKFRNLF